MAVEARDTEKLRKLVRLLAGENCGECGHNNCGAFAMALADGKASPVDCRKSRGNVQAICDVLGVPVPEGAATPAGKLRGHHGDGHHRHGHRHHGHGRGHRHSHHHRAGRRGFRF